MLVTGCFRCIKYSLYNLLNEKGFCFKNSVNFFAEKLHILQSEIIAVGNTENDLTMVQYAGLSLWLDNIDPELRHHADVIAA